MSNRTAYCSIVDVKRWLSQQQKKVRFSDAYRRLEWDTNNSGTIRLASFSVSPDYQGQERFEMIFSNSEVFTMMGDELGYMGDGTRTVTFQSNDEMFTIESGSWVGTAVTDDKVSFETAANISDTNGLAFMRDAMMFTNGKMRELYGDATNIPFYSDLVPIPHEIELANIMLASCYIFNSIFVGGELEASPVQKWCEQGENILDGFIEDARKMTPARWRSRPAHITETGIEGVESGVIGENDVADNESYSR